MANTYTQLYVHLVFAVQGRQNLIPKSRKEELHKYISGIVHKRKTKLLAINCMPDHAHIFVGLNPSLSISDLVRDIKTNSSMFITDTKIVKGKFNWQEGYGAFTNSHPQIGKVIAYIENQEEHHRTRTFKEEYLRFLNELEIPFESQYLFEFIDGVEAAPLERV